MVAEARFELAPPRRADFECGALAALPRVLRGIRSVTGSIRGPEMLIVGTVPGMSAAWGPEPCADSAHPDNDGTSARSGPEGAAQNDGETHGLRADVAPMLAGASREDGEMDMTALRSQLADLIMELFEAEIGEENWTPVDMRHDKRTGQILALFEEDGGAQEVVRIRVEHLPPTEPTE